ncbi:Mur ligase family protein [Candidatus Saccharibacteria bacterium]|nr:Mur ligase family protein [Candidatus Saccharibacteria bacterium]
MEKATKKSSLKPKLQKAKVKVANTIHGKPAKDLKIIAVAGHTGSETVAHFIHEILSAHKVPAALITSPADSPISTLMLYRYLSKCLKSGATHVIIEAPAASIKKQVFYKLPIHMAVLTNTVSPDIIGTDIADLVAQKSTLFQDSPHFIVLNRDDPQYDHFSTFAAKTATTTYGQHREAKTRINRSKLYKKGTEASLAHDSATFDVATFAIGEEAVALMAAAAAAANLLGVPDDIIVEGIASYEP